MAALARLGVGTGVRSVAQRVADHSLGSIQDALPTASLTKMTPPTLGTARALVGDELQVLYLPPPEAEVVRDVSWGRPEELFTPAYWRAQVWYRELVGACSSFRLGRTLIEEVAACLLGGHGMPAEVGIAAFERIRDRGLLDGPPWPTAEEFIIELETPLQLFGRSRQYRFPRHRGRLLARNVRLLGHHPPPTNTAREFRQALTTCPGIGYKTASWITRNHLASHDVAILDIHVMRAGALIGLWPSRVNPARSYLALEERFLVFARSLGVRAGMLDAVMWADMRAFGGSSWIEGQAGNAATLQNVTIDDRTLQVQKKGEYSCPDPEEQAPPHPIQPIVRHSSSERV